MWEGLFKQRGASISTTGGGSFGDNFLLVAPFFKTGFDDGISNSLVLPVQFTLPYEDTKKISKAKLFWLNDDWMNTNTLLGSLDKDEMFDKRWYWKSTKFERSRTGPNINRPTSREKLYSGRTGLITNYEGKFKEGLNAHCQIKEVIKGGPAYETGKIKKGDQLLGIASTANYLNFNFVSLGLPGFKNRLLEHRWPEYYRPTDETQKSLGKLRLDLHEQRDSVVSGCIEMVEKLLSGPPDTYVYLLVKPADNPTERKIVPILRKRLSDFEKNSEE